MRGGFLLGRGIRRRGREKRSGKERGGLTEPVPKHGPIKPARERQNKRQRKREGERSRGGKRQSPRLCKQKQPQFDCPRGSSNQLKSFPPLNFSPNQIFQTAGKKWFPPNHFFFHPGFKMSPISGVSNPAPGTLVSERLYFGLA